MDLAGKSMAVQGFGNAGQYAALLGAEVLGLNLIAASDSRGGIFNPDGIDIRAAIDFKLKSGSLTGFPGGKFISNEELIELDVAVLFPAALEGVITGQNAARVRAKIVCELANGPTTQDADGVFDARNVLVIPDFLANAGGVTVSYFEQVQNAYNYYRDLDLVQKRLDEKMTKAFHAVYELQKRARVNMREAAYLVAVQRVAEVCKLRGWI
jgi:glutamate dehydrogenase (NAD(P)+)